MSSSKQFDPPAVLSEASLPASVTVESALLLPSVLLVLLLMLYLMAHVHDRSALLSSACEQAAAGTEREVSVLFLNESYSRSGSETRAERSVRYELSTAPLLSGSVFQEELEAVYERIEPSAFMHLASALHEQVQQDTD